MHRPLQHPQVGSIALLSADGLSYIKVQQHEFYGFGIFRGLQAHPGGPDLSAKLFV